MASRAALNSDRARVRYSQTEERVFGIIAKARSSVTTADVVAELFPGEDQPYHARTVTLNTLRSLLKKMKLNGESNKIQRIKTPGERQHSYVLEKGTQ